MVGARAFLCLVVVSCVTASKPAGPAHSGSYSGPTALTFAELEALVDALEQNYNSDLVAFSDAATLLAAGDELIDLIDDRRLPSINQINAQQDSILEEGRAQVKALEHRADEAFSQASRSLTVARRTDATLREQNSVILREQEANTNQTIAIDALNNTIIEWQQSILNSIADEFTFLNALQDAAEDRIQTLQDFVDSRICEYGEAVTTNIGEDQFIAFKVPFTTEPQVSLTTIGFRGQLDIKSYDHYDQVALDRHVTTVDTDGFTVAAQDLSAGMVAVDTIYSAYMACQNIGAGGVDLPDTTVTRPPPTTKVG